MQKKDDMQRKTEEKDRWMKVEGRKRKWQKRIGSGKTKLKKYIFYLENRKQQKKKEENDGIEVALYICAGEISSRDASEVSQGLQSNSVEQHDRSLHI